MQVTLKEYLYSSKKPSIEKERPLSLLQLPIEIIYKIFMLGQNLNALLRIKKSATLTTEKKLSDPLNRATAISLTSKEIKTVFNHYQTQAFMRKYLFLFAKYALNRPYASLSLNWKFNKIISTKLLAHIPIERHSTDLLAKIVISQDLRGLTKLLKNPTFDSSQNHAWAFKHACKKGNLPIVKTMIEDLGINPRLENDEPFYLACYYGHFALALFFIEKFKIDLSRFDSFALFQACHGNNLELVNYILEHKNVDPSAWKNRALIAAIIMGSEQIVERLLQDSRIDPSANDNEALVKACCGTDKPLIVGLLLQDKRVNPKARNNTPLWRAKQLENRQTTALLKDHLKKQRRT